MYLSRLSDLFVGHMKAFVLTLNAGCIVTSYWFIIVAQQYVAFSRSTYVISFDFMSFILPRPLHAPW